MQPSLEFDVSSTFLLKVPSHIFIFILISVCGFVCLFECVCISVCVCVFTCKIVNVYFYTLLCNNWLSCTTTDMEVRGQNRISVLFIQFIQNESLV